MIFAIRFRGTSDIRQRNAGRATLKEIGRRKDEKVPAERDLVALITTLSIFVSPMPLLGHTADNTLELLLYSRVTV
jgi:hypothetical protein